MELLQQSLVPLLGHLLDQQLRGNQHAHVHMTGWKLQQKKKNQAVIFGHAKGL